jgi:GntR family transcriptional regulator
MALDLHISTGSGVPIYRQVMDQICRAISTGNLASGDQLPSVRALAEDLVINPNTVARAYGDLIREGILEARQGKGVFVARRRAVYTKAERLRRIEPYLESFLGQAVLLGFAPGEIRDLLEEKQKHIESSRRDAGGSEKGGSRG